MFVIILISAVITASVILLNTSHRNIVINNNQIQSREICKAGLSVFMEHLEKQPNDYISLLNLDNDNKIDFNVTVEIPYRAYVKDNTSENVTYNIADVNINIIEDLSKENKLIATATTNYNSVSTTLKLEIFYDVVESNCIFTQGDFFN